MKRISKTLVTFLILLTISLLTINSPAQTPPPPNGGGNPIQSGNTPVGGGAPIGDGLLMLLAMGTVYGLRKKSS